MPGYRGHLVGGGVTYFILLYILSIYNPDPSIMAQGLIFCLVGALFPDIDIKSMGQKYFYIALIFLLAFCLLYGHYSWFFALTFLSIVPLFNCVIVECFTLCSLSFCFPVVPFCASLCIRLSMVPWQSQMLYFSPLELGLIFYLIVQLQS